ncbi:MAG: fructosamine kinase family protein [Lentimicrobium sp.]|nr:fructosamine kinase family protein [Lentimicrobium sp.]
MFPDSILNEINLNFGKSNPAFQKFRPIKALSGGCINDCYELGTAHKHIFVKFNSAGKYPGMFDAEKKGLELLKTAKCISVPEVLMCTNAGEYSFLALEFISPGNSSTDFWGDFGRKLALMHKNHADTFGLNHNNYIGSLAQNNNQSNSWTDFYVTQRLEPLVKQAYEKGLLSNSNTADFDRLFSILDDLIPGEPASLLHGDLWNGNFLIDKNGTACLIDPAVYYGHREMDIAMTKLFGGFSPRFYDSYNQEYPLENDWKERVKLNQLYPLLVHLLLFGSSYALQIRSILNDFV